MQQAFEWVKANVLPTIQRLGDLVMQHMPQIQALWTGTMTAIGNVVEAVWPPLSSIIESALTLIMGLVDTASAVMNSDWGGAMRSIASIGEWAFGDVAALIGGFWESAVSSFAKGVSGVLEEMGKLPGAILGAVSGAGSWLVSAGQDIIRGLCDGISGAAGWVVNAVNSACANALDAVKAFFGIASPSKVMKGVGGYLMEGLSEGIEGGASDAARSMGAAARRVSDAASFGWGAPGGTPGAAVRVANIYIDGARINDEPQIRDATRGFLVELMRTAAI